MKKPISIFMTILLLISGLNIAAYALEPPWMITFRGGYEELCEIISALDKEDEELEEYLRDSKYSWEGIFTRESAEKFVKLLNAIYLPYMENSEPAYIDIRPGVNDARELILTSVSISFEIDGIRYRFYFPINPKEGLFTRLINKIINTFNLSRNINKSSEDVKIYTHRFSRILKIFRLSKRQYFSFDVHGGHVWVSTFGEAKYSYIKKAVQDFDFMKIEEIYQIMND